jgi:DNA polymerase III epsilon subunit-like protein
MRDDRKRTEDWARKLMADDFVILDTETTGLYSDAEIVQLAVIDKTGAVLLDTLIKPTQPIPERAIWIHGITDAMVEHAPTFDEIYNALLMAIGGKRVVIYNASFDIAMLHQSEQWDQIRRNPQKACLGQDGWQGLAVWEDAMIPYSDWVGDWSNYHRSNRWQSLPGGDHTALGDARATLALIKRMAGHVDIGIAKEQVSNE